MARSRSAPATAYPIRLLPALPAHASRASGPEQARGLRPVDEGGGRDDARHRRQSQAPRRPDRRHRRAAPLGLDPHPSSACAHDRARRGALARRITMGRLPLQLPRARQPAGAPVQRQDAGDAHGCARRRPVHVLQPARRARRQDCIQALHRPAAANKWVVYCKAPFAGPKQVQRYLSRCTHRVAISNHRLVAADDAGVAFRWKDYRVDGPDRWKTMRLHPHEFIGAFSCTCCPEASTASAIIDRKPGLCESQLIDMSCTGMCECVTLCGQC